MKAEIIFALISTVFLIMGAIPLWRDIFRGRSIPHPLTKWIWLILVGFNAFVLVEAHEYWSLIPTGFLLLELIGEMTVGLFMIKRISMNWFDGLCLLLAILAILYFFLTRNTLNTVISTMIIDGIACLPTFKKGWIQPWTETTLSYSIGAFAQWFTILSLSAPNLETSLYWGFIFFIDIFLVIFICARRYSLKGWKSIFE